MYRIQNNVALEIEGEKKKISLLSFILFHFLFKYQIIVFLPYPPQAFIESKGGDNSDAWAEDVEAEVEAATASEDKDKEESSSKSSSLEQKSKEEEEGEEGRESRKSSIKATRKKQV